MGTLRRGTLDAGFGESGRDRLTKERASGLRQPTAERRSNPLQYLPAIRRWTLQIHPRTLPLSPEGASSSTFALSTPVDHSSFADPCSPLSIEGGSNTLIMPTLPVQNTITSTISVGPRPTHTRQYSSIVTAAGTRLREKGKGNDKEAQGVWQDRTQSQRQIKRILFFPTASVTYLPQSLTFVC